MKTVIKTKFKKINADGGMPTLLYENCRMDLLYYSQYETELGIRCSVRFNKYEIVVSIPDEENNIIYRGTGKNGHFNLKSSHAGGNGTLHMFTGGHFLEGHFNENDAQGLWIIWLK